MGDIKIRCLIKKYIFARRDGLINRLLLRNVFTSYLVINTLGNLHTNAFLHIMFIFIYCNWVVARWQWLFYMYTKHELGFSHEHILFN